MIDYIITEHETGFNKEYFDNHPSSNRKVYRICDKCEKISWVEYKNGDKLCRSCSLKNRKLTEEHKANISKSCKKNSN